MAETAGERRSLKLARDRPFACPSATPGLFRLRVSQSPTSGALSVNGGSGADEVPEARFALLILLRGRVEAAKPRRLANDMAVHRLQQILARRVGRQIQLCVESIKLEHVVMYRPRASARPEIRRRIPTTGRNARTVPRSVGQIARPQSLRRDV